LSPSARRPSFGFDVDNKQADASENGVVADGHADLRASAAMADDNDDDTDDSSFNDTLVEILGALFRPDSGTRLLSTVISLLVPSTPTSTSLALAFCPPLPP